VSTIKILMAMFLPNGRAHSDFHRGTAKQQMDIGIGETFVSLQHIDLMGAPDPRQLPQR
jgi:hypothetical protein